MTPTTVYVRTEAGRIEIHEKKSGLTQSERLVLIMVDGVACCGQIQQKLSSLTTDRFSRALKTLLKKELISEIFLQVEDQPAEEIDQSIVDRYLHQDPLDPVTIISFHPEDEFEDTKKEKASPVLASESVPELTQIVATPAIDVAHAKLADELHDELAARNVEWKRKQAEQHATGVGPNVRVADSLTSFSGAAISPTAGRLQADTSRKAMIRTAAPAPSQSPTEGIAPLKSDKLPLTSRLSELHWGYWLIASGSAFILGFLVLRLFRA
jgi:hypothetical protein